jgi:hypothetical protein
MYLSTKILKVEGVNKLKKQAYADLTSLITISNL